MTTKAKTLLMMLAWPVLAMAQRVDEFEFDRTEAWAMKYFGAVGQMHGNGPPAGLAKGGWAASLELDDIPHLTESYRTVGFDGTKVEDLNKAPVLVRPLLHYGLTERLSLTAAYVIPVEVFDGIELHMAGLSVNWVMLRKSRWQAQLRLSGVWTEARGDFTVPARYVGDPTKDTFAAIAPSRDTYEAVLGGIEVGIRYRLPVEREVYALFNASYTYGDYRFDVYVPQANDRAHERRQLTDGSIWTFSAGAEMRFSARWSGRLLLAYAPLDVRRPPDYDVENDSMLNLRSVLNYQF